MKYQLQLDYTAYIIAGEQITECSLEAAEFGEDDRIDSGVAITYPEHDLLWLLSSPRDEAPECLNTVRKFRREFSSLPRWEATRYAVETYSDRTSEEAEREGRICVFPYDCRTGERLLEVNYYDRKTGKKLTACGIIVISVLFSSLSQDGKRKWSDCAAALSNS